MRNEWPEGAAKCLPAFSISSVGMILTACSFLADLYKRTEPYQWKPDVIFAAFPRLVYMAIVRRIAERIILVVAAIVQLSCASTDLPSIDETSSSFIAEEDEKKLWAEAESFEAKLVKSGLLYQDPDLDRFLASVLQKLLSPGLRVSDKLPRIKVIKNPLLNAFAMPHGLICVNSGILVRMVTEDQLAAVVSHELIHFTHRHSLKQIRSTANKQNTARVLGVLLGTAGFAVGGGYGLSGLADSLSTGWVLSSVQGYSRELEGEADTAGFNLMTKAKYDPLEAIRIFELLQEDRDQHKIKEPFFYGTHPRLQERIANYRNLTALLDLEHTSRSQSDYEAFQKYLNPLYLVNAELDLNIGRVNAARDEIEKHLRLQPRSSRAYYLLGEVHRRPGPGQGDVKEALKAYRTAAEMDPGYPEPHRELGLLYRSMQSDQQARKEFDLYLSLSPKAPDAPIIKGFLNEPS